MKPQQAIDLAHSETGISPFSNGSEGMQWYSENCERCKKALICNNPEKHENMRDGGVSETLSGENCFGEYAIAVSYITGKVPEEISIWMGGTETRLPEQCRFFSDDDKDRPENRPEPIAPNQLKIPFLCTSLFGFDDPNILVFDTAIIEKECYSFSQQ